jgi:hypothetical protein
MHAHAPLAHVDFDAVVGLMPADLTAARVAARGRNWESAASQQLVADLNINNRRPVYAPHDSSVRIVSRPNGMWRVERRITERGTREVDNWIPISHDTTKDSATARMLTFTQTPL